jgi:hypothetical protein
LRAIDLAAVAARPAVPAGRRAGTTSMKPKKTPSGRVRRYRLIEYFASGYVLCEDFPAPSDEDAIRRAMDVCTAARVEIWRSRVLIDRLPREGNAPLTSRSTSPAVGLPSQFVH